MRKYFPKWNEYPPENTEALVYIETDREHGHIVMTCIHPTEQHPYYLWKVNQIGFALEQTIMRIDLYIKYWMHIP